MRDVNVDRVLIVEPPDGRDTIRLGLEMAGYEVDVADDAETGLMLAATHAPAAAIIDLGIEPMNGCQLAQAVRELYGSRIRLVAVTARDDPEDANRSRAAGFDVHLVKPVSPNRVHQELRHLLFP
jgi:DNA-binding response OmpR family regulator